MLAIVFVISFLSSAAMLYGLLNDRIKAAVYGVMANALPLPLMLHAMKYDQIFEFWTAWGLGTAAPLLSSALMLILTWNMRQRMKSLGS
jgi:hypothetical protein